MYAKQAKNLDAERHASEIRVRVERGCGELLADTPKAKGELLRGNKMELREESTQTLSDLGITKRQSSDWQKLAAIPAAQFEASLATQEIPSTNGVLNHRAQGTGENEWYTPAEYIEAVRDVLKVIELDPASSSLANETVKAKRFYSKEDDGLNQS